MKYKHRTLEKAIKTALATFPAIVITGPRQSGKTTMLQQVFSGSFKFVSLEDPDIRMRAKADPRQFLAQYSPPVIIDEIQYFPELLSYIKSIIDKKRKPGQWILAGSQNFVLMQNVSQSLAGRAAVLNLLPFSFSEQFQDNNKVLSIAQWLKKININSGNSQKTAIIDLMLRGQYPEISTNKKVSRQLWCSSYITTYLERDIRNILNIGDFSLFERFLRTCANQTGQILNISSMARDIGVSVPTARRWLSLLETGFIIYLLYPYYKNINKRLVKSPKLYFIDSALCSYLLGYQDKNTLQNSQFFGSLFESMIISDVLKRFLHLGEKPSIYYLRTRDGLEVDLVIEHEGKLNLLEIKSSMTITPRHANSLKILQKNLKMQINKMAVISNTEDNFNVTGNIINCSWKSILI